MESTIPNGEFISDSAAPSRETSFDLLPHNARVREEFPSEAELLASCQWEALHLGFNWTVKRSMEFCTYLRCCVGHDTPNQPSTEPTTKNRLNCYRSTKCPAKLQLQEITRPDGKKVWVCKASNTHHNHPKKLRYYTLNPLKIMLKRKTMIKLENAVLNENYDASDLRGLVRILVPEMDEINIMSPHHYQGFITQLFKAANGKENQDELFLQALVKKNTVHQVVVNPHNQIMSAYFAHPISLNYAVCSNGVFVVDCTHSTNVYDKPLLNVVTFDELGNNFPIAFAIMHGEAEEDYVWAYRNLKYTLELMNIPMPRVIMSNTCPASIKACAEIFPDAAKLLCRWNIQRNVKGKATPSVQDDEVRSNLLAQWTRTIDSHTQEEYDVDTRTLIETFGENYEKAVTYMRNQWLLRHDDNSSRVESFSSFLKRSLKTRTYSFHNLLLKIEDCVKYTNARLCSQRSADQQLHLSETTTTVLRTEEDHEVIRKIAQAVSNKTVKVEHLQVGWTWWMFDDVREYVSADILIELFGHFIEMHGNQDPCTNTRHRITGRPCHHTMLDCFRSRTPLRPSHFDRTLLNRNIEIASIEVDVCTEVVPLRVSGPQSFPTVVKVSSLEELAAPNKRHCVAIMVEGQEVLKRVGNQRRCKSFLEKTKSDKRTSRAVDGEVSNDSADLNSPQLLRAMTPDPSQHISSPDRDNSCTTDLSLESFTGGLNHEDYAEGEDLYADVLDESSDASDPPTDDMEPHDEILEPSIDPVAIMSVEEAPSSNPENQPLEGDTVQTPIAGLVRKRKAAIPKCTLCSRPDHNRRGCPNALPQH